MTFKSIVTGAIFAGAAASAMALSSIGVASIAATRATANDTSTDKLGYWEGHWRFESHVKETPYSHALIETGNGHCTWQASRHYMVCEYIVDKMTPDDPVKPDNLVVYHYNASKNALVYTSITPEGAPNVSTVAIEGNEWTVAYQVPRQSGGTADIRHIQKFLSPTRWTMATEISVDRGEHWSAISETVSNKVG